MMQADVQVSSLRQIGSLIDSDPLRATASLRLWIQRHPHSADAWRLLGRALRAAGDDQEASNAELEAIHSSIHDPVLITAGAALVANDLPEAEMLLRRRLHDNPFDVAAIRMMAELAGRLGRNGDAEKLLRRALELAPAFSAARSNLAMAVYRQNRPAEAIEILDALVEHDPDNFSGDNLRAAALGRLGSFEEAIDIYEKVLDRFSQHPKVWMSYGHALKTVGRLEDGVAAYRQALALAPYLGEVWWSLANLKTVPFSQEDVEQMETVLSRPDLGDTDRLHIHFALGRACEQRKDFARSFGHYAEGNRLRNAQLAYDSRDIRRLVTRSKALFTRAFFEERRGHGCQAEDPIFILGMPRAGSTLIEQILASHSAVEGTMELPDIPMLAKELGAGRSGPPAESFPNPLAHLSAEESVRFGEAYLSRTRVQRKSDRPRFIDKLPNNWINIGFIHLILPNAKIIDARRHPLDCCFSNFKQHYARGQAFSYDLSDVGRYYADYVDLLAHFDEVLPGRVHRIIHEQLIDDPEAEVRRLLDYLSLPFEEACLAFHETKRAVRTPSSEQVRQPINRQGMDQWRPYAPWLEPLRQALGDVLTAYPAAPD